MYLLDNTADEEVCINLELMNRDLAMLDFEVDPREGENQDNKTGTYARHSLRFVKLNFSHSQF